jgi:PAS domain S-box-containing protein
MAELDAPETNHKRTIEVLPKSKATLRALLESTSDAVVVANSDGRIVVVNSRTERMFGYSQDELLEQPIEVLLSEQSYATGAKPQTECSNPPHSRQAGLGLNLVGRRKDGSEFPVNIGRCLLETANDLLIIRYITDITERVRDEEALRQTLAKLQKRNRELSMLNQAGQTLTATLDLQQVVERLLHEVTEAIGAHGSSVWLWDQEQTGWLVCQAASHGGQNHPLISLRLPPGQGVAGWVAQHGENVIIPSASDDPRFAPEVDAQIGFHTTSLLAVPIRLRDEVIGVLEIVNKLCGDFDADDQGLVETMAASAAIAIENAQLVETLRRHTKELESRNKELDAFAHTVAHDLKDPLGLIIGFAETLEANYDLIPTEEFPRYLHKITHHGRKMRNIVNELLVLAGMRKKEIEIRPLDMRGIIADAQERLTYLIAEYQAEIILPKNWPMALGHAPWVEEVWVNYLSNALKFGGHPARVELGATEQEDNTVRFWVRDNGPGLPPEDQARLFTPFTQLQARTRGHGLGLSIVQSIVKELGGQVGVESKVGQGSVFFFTLPGAA